MTSLPAPLLLSTDPEAPGSYAAVQPAQPVSWRERWPVLCLIAVFAGLLLAASTLRHQMFRSGAMDLGFFDQLVYLISRGRPPVSSILGFHLLGDHAAYMLYLLAPLYWIWADVHMLLAAQAIALSAGAYPIWRLARLAGTGQRAALATALAYLLYPMVLTSNLFDFHPETFSVAAILFAVLAARERRVMPFVIALIITLGAKEVMGLVVAAMGFWLMTFERRRLHGAIAMLMGFGWFVFATQWLIPHFGQGKQASGVMYYSYLGSSIAEIATNLLLHPMRWIPIICDVRVAKYLAILLGPLIWGLHPRHMAPLLAALPVLCLNVLSDPNRINMTSPLDHYSLMIVPFLLICVIGAQAAGKSWLKRPVSIAGWSVGLVLLGVAGRIAVMNSHQTTNLENQLATRQALRHIDGKGGVLTTHELTPHLSQRSLVQYIDPTMALRPLEAFDYILLNLCHDSSKTAGERTMAILEAMHRHPEFELRYQREWVYLFQRAGTQTEVVGVD